MPTLRGSDRLFILVLVFVMGQLAACAPSPDDTVALIRAGDERACSSPDVKRRLQEALTPFLQYRKLKPDFEGQSLANFGFVFDPIISTSAAKGSVECAASAYLSLDGKTPFASNQIQFQYSLATNLNNESEFVLQGPPSYAIETATILYENSGVLR